MKLRNISLPAIQHFNKTKDIDMTKWQHNQSNNKECKNNCKDIFQWKHKIIKPKTNAKNTWKSAYVSQALKTIPRSSHHDPIPQLQEQYSPLDQLGEKESIHGPNKQSRYLHPDHFPNTHLDEVWYKKLVTGVTR